MSTWPLEYGKWLIPLNWPTRTADIAGQKWLGVDYGAPRSNLWGLNLGDKIGLTIGLSPLIGAGFLALNAVHEYHELFGRPIGGSIGNLLADKFIEKPPQVISPFVRQILRQDHCWRPILTPSPQCVPLTELERRDSWAELSKPAASPGLNYSWSSSQCVAPKSQMSLSDFAAELAKTPPLSTRGHCWQPTSGPSSLDTSFSRKSLLPGDSPLRDFGVKLGLGSLKQDAWHSPWRGPSSRLSLGGSGGGSLSNLWNAGSGAFSPAGGRLRLGLSDSTFGSSNRSSRGALSSLWDAGNSYRPPTSSLLDNSLSLRDIGTKLSLGSLRQDAWHSPWRGPSSRLSLGGSGSGPLSNLWNAGSSFSSASAGPPSIRLSTFPNLGFNTPAWQGAGGLSSGPSLSSFARGL